MIGGRENGPALGVEHDQRALALVLGEDEIAGRRATLKHLREDRPQEQVEFDALAAWFEAWLAA